MGVGKGSLKIGVVSVSVSSSPGKSLFGLLSGVESTSVGGVLVGFVSSSAFVISTAFVRLVPAKLAFTCTIKVSTTLLFGAIGPATVCTTLVLLTVQPLPGIKLTPVGR